MTEMCICDNGAVGYQEQSGEGAIIGLGLIGLVILAVPVVILGAGLYGASYIVGKGWHASDARTKKKRKKSR